MAVGFKGGQLNIISLATVFATPIALGETGAFLNSVGGTITNLASGSPIFTIGCVITYGPTVGGQPLVVGAGALAVSSTELEIGGAVWVVPGSTTLQDADKAITDYGHQAILSTITGDPLPDLTRTITQVDPQGGEAVGTVSVDLNWDTGVYSMQVHLGAVFFNNSPVFTVDGSLQFNSQGDILLTATAAVHVPSDVPIIGGDSLSMSFAFYEHSGSGYFAAWIGFDIPFFGEQDIGFKYDLGGDFSLLGTSGVQEIQAQKFTPTPNPTDAANS